MNTNYPRGQHQTNPEPPPPVEKKTKGFSQRFQSLFLWNVNFGKELPIHIFPYILWSAVLIIFYIYTQHHYEGLLRKTDKARQEVDDLRAKYINLKSNYMLMSKQSEIGPKVAERGILQKLYPPQKIVVNK